MQDSSLPTLPPTKRWGTFSLRDVLYDIVRTSLLRSQLMLVTVKLFLAWEHRSSFSSPPRTLQTSSKGSQISCGQVSTRAHWWFRDISVATFPGLVISKILSLLSFHESTENKNQQISVCAQMWNDLGCSPHSPESRHCGVHGLLSTGWCGTVCRTNTLGSWLPPSRDSTGWFPTFGR
jgi:hypothetical protein